MKVNGIEVSLKSYGQYSSDNYGAHTQVVTINNKSVYFSYDTPVAFHHPERGLVVIENRWGPTTGKHLNWICDDKRQRVSDVEFGRLFAEVFGD